MKALKILSLFDGISTGQLALKELGYNVDKYYSSEIDKHAITISNKHFPNTIQVGDIINLNVDFDIDLLIGGSPCQSFSTFGDKTGLNGKSGLVIEYIRIFKQTKPKYFLLENVRMKKEYIDFISKELGVKPVLINSSNFSGQNRNRLYWTNIPINKYEDLNIELKDVLEDLPFREIPKCFYSKWGDKMRIDKGLNWVNNKKGNCLTTKNCHTNQYLLNKDRTKCRLLTPNEYEKLQTLPLDYTLGVSNQERFKAIGNGWTLEVIKHIFKGLGDL